MSLKPPDPIFVLRGANDSISSVSFMQPYKELKTDQLIAGTQSGQSIIWNLKVILFL